MTTNFTFSLSLEQLSILDILTDAQVAKLFRAIYLYQQKMAGCAPKDVDDKINTLLKSTVMKVAFLPFRQAFEQEARGAVASRENGRKGGRPRKEAAVAKEQSKPAPDVPPSVPPSVPSEAEVADYFRVEGEQAKIDDCAGQAELFYATFNSAGWVNKFGQPIKSWQSEAKRWIYYQRQRELADKNRPARFHDLDSKYARRRGTEPCIMDPSEVEDSL